MFNLQFINRTHSLIGTTTTHPKQEPAHQSPSSAIPPQPNRRSRTPLRRGSAATTAATPHKRPQFQVAGSWSRMNQSHPRERTSRIVSRSRRWPSAGSACWDAYLSGRSPNSWPGLRGCRSFCSRGRHRGRSRSMATGSPAKRKHELEWGI